MLDSWKHCQINNGLKIYGWCIMTSHIQLITGTHGGKLEDLMRDMKKHTSIKLKKAIQQNKWESRKEWILWMMERAGQKNG